MITTEAVQPWVTLGDGLWWHGVWAIYMFVNWATIIEVVHISLALNLIFAVYFSSVPQNPPSVHITVQRHTTPVKFVAWNFVYFFGIFSYPKGEMIYGAEQDIYTVGWFGETRSQDNIQSVSAHHNSKQPRAVPAGLHKTANTALECASYNGIRVLENVSGRPPWRWNSPQLSSMPSP